VLAASLAAIPTVSTFELSLTPINGDMQVAVGARLVPADGQLWLIGLVLLIILYELLRAKVEPLLRSGAIALGLIPPLASPEAPKIMATVRTQSQTTYTSVRGATAPRFHFLPEHETGVWSD
jgi:hypothetical protein